MAAGPKYFMECSALSLATKSSNSLIFSLLFLKVGMSLPGHFSLAAAETLLRLQKMM
jgi:hypothetical protein